MGEAGAALDLGLPGISGLAERMMEAGLIDKRADPADGRTSRLWLTAAGRKELTRAKGERRRHQCAADGRIYRS